MTGCLYDLEGVDEHGVVRFELRLDPSSFFPMLLDITAPITDDASRYRVARLDPMSALTITKWARHFPHWDWAVMRRPAWDALDEVLS